MTTQGTEYRFKRRVLEIAEDKGFLVLVTTNKSLFDAVLVKDQLAFPIEMKGFKTEYKVEQMRRQRLECKRTGTYFFVIRQSKQRGKMIITSPCASIRFDDRGTPNLGDMLEHLQSEFEEFLLKV